MTQIVNKLKIMQHNVRHWPTQKYAYYNIYRTIDPDIIFLNEHGQDDLDKIKLFGYHVHKKKI